MSFNQMSQNDPPCRDPRALYAGALKTRDAHVARRTSHFAQETLTSKPPTAPGGGLVESDAKQPSGRPFVRRPKDL